MYLSFKSYFMMIRLGVLECVFDLYFLKKWVIYHCFSGKMLDELHHVASKELYNLMHQIHAVFCSVKCIIYIRGLLSLINKTDII